MWGACLPDILRQDDIRAPQPRQGLREPDQGFQLAHSDAVAGAAARDCVLTPQALVALHQHLLGLQRTPAWRLGPGLAMSPRQLR